jgi:hypothetical protein
MNRKHGASALTWADDLEAAAQKWANNCVFKHSGGTLGPFGENLAAGTGASYTIATAVNSWAVEVCEFKISCRGAANVGSPLCSQPSTTPATRRPRTLRRWCGRPLLRSDALSPPATGSSAPASGCVLLLHQPLVILRFTQKASFHVCEYRLQGNVIGEFDQNVQV